MGLFLLSAMAACSDPCVRRKEPAGEADLPFEHSDLIAALREYAPVAIVWDVEGPGAAAMDSASVSLEPTGDGYVFQYRHPDGSICGDGAIAEHLPVRVSVSIGDGELTTNSLDLVLTAQSTAFGDMNLYSEVDGQVTGYAFDATVSPAWALECAEMNPDTFSAAPEHFWLEIDQALDPLGVVVFGYGREDGFCWKGEIRSAP